MGVGLLGYKKTTTKRQKMCNIVDGGESFSKCFSDHVITLVDLLYRLSPSRSVDYEMPEIVRQGLASGGTSVGLSLS